MPGSDSTTTSERTERTTETNDSSDASWPFVLDMSSEVFFPSASRSYPGDVPNREPLKELPLHNSSSYDELNECEEEVSLSQQEETLGRRYWAQQSRVRGDSGLYQFTVYAETTEAEEDSKDLASQGAFNYDEFRSKSGLTD